MERLRATDHKTTANKALMLNLEPKNKTETPSPLKRRFQVMTQPRLPATDLLKKHLAVEDATISETDDDFEDDSSIKSEEETEIAQALARAAFARNNSSSVLDELMRAAFVEHSNGPPTKKQRTDSLRLTASAPNLPELATTKNLKQPVVIGPRPEECLKSLVECKFVPFRSIPDFFVKLDQDNISSYDVELVRAVRDQDLEQLEELSKTRSMFAGNRFGETILHAACRRGSVDVVRFLLSKQVPVNVCCDYGRTPLHDACWTSSPNFELIEILLEASPDCLYITDQRGFTPLSYIPGESYQVWCDFLRARGADKLQPKGKGQRE